MVCYDSEHEDEESVNDFNLEEFYYQVDDNLENEGAAGPANP